MKSGAPETVKPMYHSKLKVDTEFVTAANTVPLSEEQFVTGDEESARLRSVTSLTSV